MLRASEADLPDDWREQVARMSAMRPLTPPTRRKGIRAGCWVCEDTGVIWRRRVFRRGWLPLLALRR
jgi:hypothetical protein